MTFVLAKVAVVRQLDLIAGARPFRGGRRRPEKCNSAEYRRLEVLLGEIHSHYSSFHFFFSRLITISPPPSSFRRSSKRGFFSFLCFEHALPTLLEAARSRRSCGLDVNLQ